MIERTIYECEHCHKKRLLSKYAMRDHEEKCFYNPDSKACIMCNNFIQNYALFNGRECLMKQDIRLKLKSNCPYWQLKKWDGEIYDD